MRCKKCNKELNEEAEIDSIQEDTVLGGMLIIGYECSECGYSEEK